MTLKDPTLQGLSITPDQPQKYRDVFDYVYQQRRLRQEAATCDTEAMDAAVLDFIETARTLFAANRPVSQDFMHPSLALRFQDGSVLQFCEVPGDTMGGNAGSQDVSKAHQAKGKGGTSPSPSWGVTGQQ